jgi:3-oxoacyl-[acyl-carrier protein] reductase
VEFARFGVRVNGVLPGFIPTDLVEGLLKADGGAGITKQIILKSFGEVEDVARAVTFLVDPDAKYMTGSFITVDGGASTALGLGRPLKK